MRSFAAGRCVVTERPEREGAAKPRLRAWGRRRRARLAPEVRAAASEAVVDRLRAWLAGRSRPLELLLYRALPDEVETSALFRTPPADRIFAPRLAADGEEMVWVEAGPGAGWRRGRFGVLEPAGARMWRPSTGVESVLAAPLTAFDRAGGRIGMGQGCFDRWLAAHRPHLAAVVGLAFSCQECDCVPMEPHDQPLEWIFTEKEAIACRSGS